MKKKNIERQLRKKLSEITKTKSDKLFIVSSNNGKPIEINSSYSEEEFGFSAGQLVKGILKPEMRPRIGICVGIGKGCPDSNKEDQLWFLFHGYNGIVHFCGNRKKDFEKEKIVLLK